MIGVRMRDPLHGCDAFKWLVFLKHTVNIYICPDNQQKNDHCV